MKHIVSKKVYIKKSLYQKICIKKAFIKKVCIKKLFVSKNCLYQNCLHQNCLYQNCLYQNYLFKKYQTNKDVVCKIKEKKVLIICKSIININPQTIKQPIKPPIKRCSVAFAARWLKVASIIQFIRFKQFKTKNHIKKQTIFF